MKLDDIVRVNKSSQFIDIAIQNRGENTFFLTSQYGWILFNFSDAIYRGWGAFRGISDFGENIVVYETRSYFNGGGLKMSDLIYIDPKNLSEEDRKKMEAMKFKYMVIAKKKRRKFMFERTLHSEILRGINALELAN